MFIKITPAFLIIVLFVIISFDKNIFSTSAIESIQIKQRQQYFNLELGRIYGNRFGIYYFDTLRPIFSKLSTNFSNSTPLFIFAFFLILIYVKFKPLDESNKRHYVILTLIILLAAFLRFYKLNEIPAGLHGDGASQGYNAFSLIHTGKDRYGQSLPILFRSNGSYQPPIYTYLTTVPVLIFGNTVFAARFLSALSGTALVLITYFFLPSRVALIGALVIAISPWSVFFSRLTVEANLAVSIFALSILLFMASLKKKYLFPVACLILGLSTHAYYSERLISILFLPSFVLIFRKVLIREWVIFGLIIFAITQIPHLLVLQSGAFANRFNQVGLGSFTNYLTYFSLKNLFFDSGNDLGRLMPDLGVFYGWMLIPFLVGLVILLKYRLKILGILLLITPIPAGFTGDLFYPLRALDFLWVITLIISYGIYRILALINLRKSKIILCLLVTFYALISLYISYFILFKYEKSKDYGYVYVRLMGKLSDYKDKHIVIDSARDPGIEIRLAYLKEYDPVKIQSQLFSQFQTSYYSSKVNTNETLVIGNIEIKPLDWGEAGRKNYIFCGDGLAISEKNVLEHRLKLEFEIPDLGGLTKDNLLCYSTHS